MTDDSPSPPQFTRHAPRPTDPPAGVLETNLAAIATRQPALAHRLRAVPLDADVRFMIGRSGQPTAQVRVGDEWRWLACSSAPAASAPAVAGNFSLDATTIAIVGAGSGHELAAMAGRLRYHQAIVCALGEGPDGLAAAAAALSVCDVSDAVSAGRLIFAAESGAGSLLDFLNANIGYMPPGQVLRWPWQSPEEFAAITARLDAITRARVAAVAERSADVARRFAALAPVGGGVLGVSVGAECAARLAIDGLVACAGPAGRTFHVNGPDGVAPIALAAAVAEFAPGLVVMADRSRSDVSPPLPAAIRVESWAFDPAGPLTAQAKSRAGQATADDRVFAISDAVAAALTEAGWSAKQVTVLPSATDPAVFAPDPSADAICDVAIIGDVGAIDAESLHIDWASHRQLWDECGRQVRRDAAYTPARAEEIVARAMRASGVTVADEAGRAKFADAVRTRLAPTVLRLAVVTAMQQAGCTVRLIGSGWDGHGFDAEMIRRAPATWADARRVYTTARLIAFVDDADLASPAMLDAAACGVPVLVRQVAAGVGLGRLLSAGTEFAPAASPEQFAQVAKALLADESCRRRMGEAARERIGREHTFAQRFKTE